MGTMAAETETNWIDKEYRLNGEVVTIATPEGLSEADTLAHVRKWNDDNEAAKQGLPPLAENDSASPNTQPDDTFDTLVREVPAMVGSIVAATAAGKIPKVAQMGWAAGTAAIAGASAAGGAVGEAGQIAIEYATDSPHSPEGLEEASRRISGSGVEMGLWDLAGNLVIKGYSDLVRPFKGTASAYSKKLQQQMMDNGGSFMLHELSDSRIAKTLGGWANISFLGGNIIKDQAIEQGVVIKKMSEKLSDKITGNIAKLGNADRSKVTLDAIKNGEISFKSAADTMYKELDVLVGQQKMYNTVMVESEILIDASGAPAMIPKVMEELVDNAPVDMRSIKEFAKEGLATIERVGTVGGTESKRILQSLADRPDKMLFSDSNLIRSDILSLARTVEGSEKGKIKLLSGQLSEMATKAMSDAAENSGNQAIKQAYFKANKFYANGKEIFNNDLMRKLVKKSPEDVGKAIYGDGKIESVKAVKKALLRSASLQGGRAATSSMAKKAEFNRTWSNVQAGYIEAALNSAGKRAIDKTAAKQDHVVSALGLTPKFTETGAKETMSAVLNPKQIEKFEQFSNAVHLSQKSLDTQFGMLFQFGQAAAATGIVGSVAGLTSGSGAVGAASAAAVLGSPYLLAKMMVNPKNVDILMAGMKTKASSNAGKKLLEMFGVAAAAVLTEEKQSNNQE